MDKIEILDVIWCKFHNKTDEGNFNFIDVYPNHIVSYYSIPLKVDIILKVRCHKYRNLRYVIKNHENAELVNNNIEFLAEKYSYYLPLVHLELDVQKSNRLYLEIFNHQDQKILEKLILDIQIDGT